MKLIKSIIKREVATYHCFSKSHKTLAPKAYKADGVLE